MNSVSQRTIDIKVTTRVLNNFIMTAEEVHEQCRIGPDRIGS